MVVNPWNWRKVTTITEFRRGGEQAREAHKEDLCVCSNMVLSKILI
jgi:hypothetical protein